MEVRVEVTELKRSGDAERRRQSDRKVVVPSPVNWDVAKEAAKKILTQDGWDVRVVRVLASTIAGKAVPSGISAVVQKRAGGVAPSRRKR